MLPVHKSVGDHILGGHGNRMRLGSRGVWLWDSGLHAETPKRRDL